MADQHAFCRRKTTATPCNRCGADLEGACLHALDTGGRLQCHRCGIDLGLPAGWLAAQGYLWRAEGCIREPGNTTIVFHGNWSHSLADDEPPRFRCPACNRLIPDYYSDVVIVERWQGWHDGCFLGDLLAGLLTGQVTDALAAVGRMRARGEQPARTLTLDGPDFPPRTEAERAALNAALAADSWRRQHGG